ncbi:P-loop NTPase fold protein [Sporosarcina sp. FSL W7-1349]|uniref:KAP family P-loop NTPase fold protein n=1 Tax=Sporosarcina sp. FSL W7-1349 TaxID=2921561 RepID=UPI0030F86AF8
MAGTKEIKGIRDLPIFEDSLDLFEVKPYIQALTNFIKQCDTPITIALQGGWGTGKTSFINLINDNLKPVKQLGVNRDFSQNKNEAVRIATVHFNTWQYSQFQLGDNLGISFLSYMVEKLSADLDHKNEWFSTANAALKGLLKFGMKMGAHQIGLEVPESERENAFDQDPAKAIEILKESLTQLVGEHLEKNKYNRLVIFIDDLDRLSPPIAVGLLEVIKLFLDIENCVFVLAVDNRVVEEGITDKMVNISREKTKSFLDKMIQVPFKIPVEIYNYEKFIEENLGDILGKGQQRERLHDLIMQSIGSNPRAMKRLINSYYLNSQVNMIIDGKEIIEEEQSVLLAIICMQLSYQPLYITLYHETDKLDILNGRFAESTHPFAEDLADTIKRYESLKVFDQGDIELILDEIISFLDILRQVLLLAAGKTSDELLEEEDIAVFNKILVRSDMTSSSSSMQPAAKPKMYPLSTFAKDSKQFTISGIKRKASSDGTSAYESFPSSRAAVEQLIREATEANPKSVELLKDVEKLKELKVARTLYFPLLPESEWSKAEGRYKQFSVAEGKLKLGYSFSHSVAALNLYRILSYLDYEDIDQIYVEGILR